ncbi:MAG: hypothetical protein FJ147_02595 [Deltaproteobacteria bacterium]|nr:hypothetical protein [Deltaproteobacteria bacterium]
MRSASLLSEGQALAKQYSTVTQHEDSALKFLTYNRQLLDWSNWPGSVKALLVTLPPAALIAHLLCTYAVNVPYMDQWGVADVIAKAFDGTLSLSDLTFHQNETRLVFPRIFFIVLAYLTNYDARYEMWASFALACLTTYNVYRLGRHTLHGSPSAEIILLFLASVTIFSIAQEENWLWGVQLIVFVPAACLSSICTLAYSSCSVMAKFIGGILLAIVSTFSYANGMLCWLVALPVLLVQTEADRQNRKCGVLLWLISGFVSIGLYFYNYHKPSHHPSFTAALADPLSAILYILAFLGAPVITNNLDRQSFYLAVALGTCLTALFVVACSVAWRYRDDPQVRYQTVGWLALGSYALGSDAISMLGRLGFGVGMALSYRYSTFSLPFIVALIYLVPITLHTLRRKQSSPLAPWLHYCPTVLGVLLLILHLISINHWKTLAERDWRHRVQGKFFYTSWRFSRRQPCSKPAFLTLLH